MRAAGMLLRRALSFAVALSAFARISPGAAAPLARGEYIRSWLICGQFPNPSEGETRIGLTTDWLQDAGGEAAIRPRAGMIHPTSINAEAVWFEHVAETDTVDLYGHFDRITPHPQDRVAYAFTTVDSPAVQDLLLTVGSDDGVRVWLNGELVHDHLVGRGTRLDDDVVGVRLRRGGNALLVKIEQDWGGWSFALRFVDVLTDGVYDLVGLAADIDVVLHERFAGQLLQVIGDGAVLARMNLEPGEAGTARGSIRIPAADLGPPFADMRLIAGDEEIGRTAPPHPGCLETVRMLRERRCELETTYALRRPWVALDDAPGLVRRHRGMVAKAVGFLDIESMAWDDPRLPELDDAAAMLRALDRGEDYLAALRNEFWSAYYSRVDGSGQHFVTKIPGDFDPLHTYPLIVDLHGGSARPRPDRNSVHERPFIEVHPWGRGDTGYRFLGEVDILDVIRFMKTWYPIDPNRVYVTGESMGGSGAWWTVSMHPDLFAAAAPFSCSADGMFLENLRNVPVLSRHGSADWIVPVTLSRYGVNALQCLGYTVEQREYPGKGHGIKADYPAHDWLLSFRRRNRPACVTLTAAAPRYARAYWVEVLRFSDPHFAAKVVAGATRAEGRQIVSIVADNVDALRLDARRMPIKTELPLTIQAGFDNIQVPAPIPGELIVVREAAGWAVRNTLPANDDQVRPYRAGGIANLYDGEPLLIVRGTSGDPALVEAILHGALVLSRHAGGAWAEMPLGGIPVRADTELTEDELEHCNLVLLGGPMENNLVARLYEDLPIKLNDAGELLAGNRGPVDLSGAFLKLTCSNPERPQRLVHLIWARGEEDVVRRFYADVAWSGAASTEEHRPDEPDLEVREIDGPIRRRMQFACGWRWRKLPGASSPIPREVASRDGFTTALLREMLAAAGTDFAMNHGSGEGKGRLFDPRWFTLADLAVRGSPIETMIADLTGQELALIHEAWIADRRLLVMPELRLDGLVPDRTYTVVMPPGVSRLFASERLLVRNPRRGPDCPFLTLRP